MEEIKRGAKTTASTSDDTVMIDTSTGGGNTSSPNLAKHKSKVRTEEEVKKSHCTHGPKGKCVNCLTVSKEEVKETKSKCLHPPN